MILAKAEKAQLRAINKDRSHSLKDIQRARMVPLSAERLPVLVMA